MSQASVAVFNAYQNTQGEAAANQMLFAWLSDETLRDELLASMAGNSEPLFFTSHASRRDTTAGASSDYDWIDGPRCYEQPAVLLAHPDHVQQVLLDQNVEFSNSPYQGLGGYFMLALDHYIDHGKQRQFALSLLQSVSPAEYDALATLAFKGGALVALKNHEFDLAPMAENIAARYVLGIFGFAQKDLALILECTRKIGRGLQYQIMGRHFVFEPGTMIESRAGLAKLAQRATEIIGLHSAKANAALTRLQKDEVDEIDSDLARIQDYKFRSSNGEDREVLADFIPLLKTISMLKRGDSGYAALTPSEQGLIAASLVGGSVTNIQNSICIALAEIFKVADAKKLHAIRKQAIHERALNPDAQWDPKNSKITDLVKEALRISPPVVYVPRRTLKEVGLAGGHVIPAGTLVLAALAGSSKHNTQAQPGLRINDWLSKLTHTNAQVNAPDSERNGACPFSKTLGGAPLSTRAHPPGSGWTYMHSCPGMMMAMHVISHTLRQLLVLPSLAQRMNPDTGQPYGLEKRWGFQCSWYPLSYQKDMLLVQTPLQTVLPIRAPVAVHSQALRQVLALGAPFIDKVLADSKMVHFASFLFVDDDSKLVLFTMYDGDFDTYIGHFAREFGHLFDRFFAHVAVQPKIPIREHPFEFVQYLKQFVQPPVEGYYFSAYPEARTHKIVQTFTRQFDFDQIRGGR